MIRFISSTGLAFLLVLASFITVQAFPVPRYQNYVNDYANVIEQTHQQKLIRFIASLREKTGAEVAVLTLQTLEGDSIDEFANRTFNEWKIGQKDTDNGILLLVVIGTRQARIEVGYGLEPIITDGIAGAILDKMVPFFKGEWYSQGIYTGTISIINEIAKANDVTISEFPAVSRIKDPGTSGGGIGWLARLIMMLFVFFVLFGTRSGLLPLLLWGSLGHRTGYWSSHRRGGFGNFGQFGGFGGFGGGSSGGGGASRSW